MATLPVINSSSKKFAVVVGINYYNTSNQLNGCINDAIHLKTFLIEKCGYLAENIIMLVDDGTGITPNKQNIINSFNTLINKATNEQFTELWFSYSGHGSYITDTNGDEKDGHDEILCPCDFSSAGMIIDDFIYENLVVKLPKGCSLFALMDCCHSGTVFDLPYIYNTSFSTNNSNNRHVASVVTISGCRDDQVSADAYINSNYERAMSWSFLNALANAKYDIKIVDLVNNMRVLLKSGYTQVPLLAMSSNTEYDRKFMQLPTAPITPLPSSSSKPIKFKLTTDYWFKESSWNIWSLNDNKYIFPTNGVFTSKYQSTEITRDLALGKYKLCVFDSYGDGGLTSLVTDGLITLVSAKMYSGKLGEYTFEVKF